MSRKPVCVDTSAWVALFSKDDQYHKPAKDYWQQLRSDKRLLLTNDYVLDETYTILRRGKGSLPMAIAFHDLVEQSKIIEVAEINGSLRKQAWQIFVNYQDKTLSFTDCVTFAQMRVQNAFEAFTFGSDFERVGFLVRPE